MMYNRLRYETKAKFKHGIKNGLCYSTLIIIALMLAEGILSK